jgi:hypothetical protein
MGRLLPGKMLPTRTPPVATVLCMDAAEFVEWTWTRTDEEKPALAQRASDVRSGQDERFLTQARFTAETAAAKDPDFENLRGSARVSNGPEDWPDDGRDMQAWNRDVGQPLRDVYSDTLLALVAKDALGKHQRRELARPLLDEVPGLPEALGLA